MSSPIAASYWSATANIGRTPPVAPDPRSTTASYWSSPERNGGTLATTLAATNEPASYWSAVASSNPTAAYQVSLSDTVRNGVYYNRRNVPQVRNRGDAGSAYRETQKIATLTDGQGTDPLSVKLSVGDSRALDKQSNFFTNLRSSLQRLGTTLSTLTSPDAFAPRHLRSSRPEVVTGTAGVNATVTTHTVTVERLAVEAQLASNQQADPYEALGLSGSFTLNGSIVSVTATDSLGDIADKINYGEDTNKNGILDRNSEDLNGNGTLDTYQAAGVWTGSGYAPSFTYYEDINANGVIDGGEDVNDNNSLDGGTAEHGAVASIVDGRLLITNTLGGDRSLTLTETGDAMTTLGFFTVDDNNQKTLVTSIAPQMAAYTIDGVATTSARNTITDGLPGVTLQLSSLSSTPTTLSVTEETARPVSRIEDFANAYNDMIRLITSQTLKKTPIQTDVRIQDLALQAAIDTHRRVGALSKAPSALTDIGLAPGGTMSQGIDPATLDRLVAQKNDPQSAPPLTAGSPGLLGSLRRMGISSEKDMTLTIDREKLSASLKEDPIGIYQLFNVRPDGIRHRLQGTIDKATAVPNGILAYRQSTLDHYRQNPHEAQKMMANQAQAQRIAIDTRVAGGFIGSLTNAAFTPTTTYATSQTSVVA